MHDLLSTRSVMAAARYQQDTLCRSWQIKPRRGAFAAYVYDRGTYFRLGLFALKDEAESAVDRAFVFLVGGVLISVPVVLMDAIRMLQSSTCTCSHMWKHTHLNCKMLV